MNKNLPSDYLSKSYFVLGQSQIHVTTLTWVMKFSSTLAWYVLYFTQNKVQPFLAMSNQDFVNSHAFILKTALNNLIEKITLEV